MSTATPQKPNKYAVDRLARETGRDRELCEEVYLQANCLFEPAKANLLKENATPVAPALPPERKRTPAPPKEETPAKFTPSPSAFPHPMPPVKVQLPGDGSPEDIRDYFNRTYGVPRVNSTADRARRLCAKLAKSAEGVVLEPCDWQGQQATWTQIRRAEEDGYPEAKANG